MALGKPVAAQHASVVFLAEAGVLEGRKYVPLYGGADVLRDGPIVTSRYDPSAARFYGKSDGTRELTTRFIEALKDSKPS